MDFKKHISGRKQILDLYQIEAQFANKMFQLKTQLYRLGGTFRGIKPTNMSLRDDVMRMNPLSQKSDFWERKI